MEDKLEVEEKLNLLSVEHDYNKILRMEEISLRMKSRISWLKVGNRNTKFSHKMASWKGAMNSLNMLMIDGEWVYDQVKIRDVVEKFYAHFDTDPFPIRPELEGVDFDHISEDQHWWLERPFFVEEVKMALNSMEEDKAPGPNGCPTKFLLACWDMVGTDVMAIFSDFHSKDQWCKCLRVTFIIFIPKKKGTVELKDFRPISLVGCIYKLLAKTLAICLKSILGDVIFESQHAFLPERQMTDCSLLANEITDAMVREG